MSTSTSSVCFRAAGESDLKLMMTGRGVILESRFRLTYGMLLNLLRVEDLKVRQSLVW